MYDSENFPLASILCDSTVSLSFRSNFGFSGSDWVNPWTDDTLDKLSEDLMDTLDAFSSLDLSKVGGLGVRGLSGLVRIPL